RLSLAAVPSSSKPRSSASYSSCFAVLKPKCRDASLPSRPNTYVLGIAINSYSRAISPARSRTISKSTGTFCKNASAASEVLSSLTPMMTSPSSAYLRCIPSSHGSERRHGPHQEAQKSTTTTLPRYFEMSRSAAESSAAATAGSSETRRKEAAKKPLATRLCARVTIMRRLPSCWWIPGRETCSRGKSFAMGEVFFLSRPLKPVRQEVASEGMSRLFFQTPNAIFLDPYDDDFEPAATAAHRPVCRSGVDFPRFSSVVGAKRHAGTGP